MYDILNVTNTKCELEMTKTRLSLLMDRKEKLYCKYFPITAKIKEVMVDGGDRDNDKMAQYVAELHEVDETTGKSLADEIEEKQETIDKLQGYLNIMSNSLSNMTGIEYELYNEIVCKGTKVTRAVDIVAERNGVEPRTIWRHHYKNIKKEIKKIKNFNKCH